MLETGCAAQGRTVANYSSIPPRGCVSTYETPNFVSPTRFDFGRGAARNVTLPESV